MATHYKGTKTETAALDAFIKLQRASESIASFLAAHVAEDGLTLPQFGALEALLHLGPLCQKELGKKLLRSGGNVTMVVDNLEKRRLVRRVRSKEDRRYVTVQLTTGGRALIEEAFPRHSKAITEAFSALTRSEQRQIADLCKRVGLSLAH